MASIARTSELFSSRCRAVANWRAVAAVWGVVAGVICLAFDERLQPILTRWGAAPSLLGTLAEYWQRLGEWPGIVLFLAVPLLMLRRERWTSFRTFAGSLAITGIIAQTTKHLLGRARPNAVGDITQFYGPWRTLSGEVRIQLDSMPSGHTAAAFCMATVLSHQWPRLWYLWWTLAVGVGISRTLVDRHFPSDVVFGALLGIIVAAFALSRLRHSDTITSGR